MKIIKKRIDLFGYEDELMEFSKAMPPDARMVIQQISFGVWRPTRAIVEDAVMDAVTDTIQNVVKYR